VRWLWTVLISLVSSSSPSSARSTTASSRPGQSGPAITRGTRRSSGTHARRGGGWRRGGADCGSERGRTVRLVGVRVGATLATDVDVLSPVKGARLGLGRHLGGSKVFNEPARVSKRRDKNLGIGEAFSISANAAHVRGRIGIAASTRLANSTSDRTAMGVDNVLSGKLIVRTRLTELGKVG
jgi:hypothetical protein